jgi:hypothetical protein
MRCGHFGCWVIATYITIAEIISENEEDVGLIGCV